MLIRTWKRRGKWAAHLFLDVCPYLLRGCTLKPRPGGPPPWEDAALSPSGLPFGSVCPWCSKKSRDDRAELRQVVRECVTVDARPLWVRALASREVPTSSSPEVAR